MDIRIQRLIFRLAALVAVLVAFARPASAQGASQPQWSVEAAAGVQLHYTGTIQSLAFGFAPNRNFTILVGAERSRTEDDIEFYPDGYAAERGGIVQFVSVEMRGALFASKPVSPYVLVGAGRGVERPNVNDFFPHGVDRGITALYAGAGARVPVHRRVDLFADWRLIVTADDGSEMAVLGPLRGGVSFRF